MTWLTWPNRITIARILFLPVLVICLLNLNVSPPDMRHLTLALFAAMAISDWLDGFLARRLKQESALGRFLDPAADKLLVMCTVILLSLDSTGVRGFVMPNWVPVIAVGKDVLIVLGSGLIYLATGDLFATPRPLGKATTALQLVTIAVVLLAPDLPTFLQGLVPALWWLASGLAVAAVADYVWAGNRFASAHAAETRKQESE